ncbi:hypothetical protein K458DRAFT_444654 [Lentithecium fluviatile CBS 122367]|uniref:Cell wall mannoprotein PIR1-like C-terminal domain-containing protein n=1 Tax=Lentithecium fluviatile CBS 122367 TaxID=1168545 RepID=A0A6G1ITZ0_9PLEO|nr:hypothetical protein K458DRAFT_444654 [Lentithecium fluviatile CBS 122367]
MRTTSILAALSFAAAVSAQAVEIGIEPDEPAPEGCDDTSKSNFTIGYQSLSTMRKRESALEAGNSALECSLKDGVLYDPRSWIGSIVANHQFQFDGPPQAGAIYTGGFSVCENGSLALGSSTRWWKCGSGDFYNLYDESIGEQCDEIRIVISYVDQPTSSSSSSSASSASSTPTPSTTPLTSINGTATTTSSSGSSSGSASGSSSVFSSAPATSTPTPSSSSAPDAPAASGGAAPSRVPRRETFGAVICILGAAIFL